MTIRRFLLSGAAVAAFVALLLPLAHADAAFGNLATLFGRQYNAEGAGVSPLESYLDNPGGFAESDSGDIIIADTNNNVLRFWSADTGSIGTYAGNGQYGETQGFRLLMKFKNPMGITIDHNNDIYIADTGNSAIRKIPANTDTDGDGYGDLVVTIVGSDKGLNRPQDLMLRGGQLFVADTGNNRVIQTDLNGNGMQVVEANLPTPAKIDWYKDRILVLMQGNQSIEEFRLDIPVHLGRRNRLIGGFQSLSAMGVRNDDLYVAAGQQGVWNEIWRVDLDSSEKDEKTLLQKNRELEILNYASGLRFRNTADGDDEMMMLFSGGNGMYRFDAEDGANEELLVGKLRYMNDYGDRSQTHLGRPIDMVLSPDRLKIYLSVNNRIAEFNLSTGQSRFIAGSSFDNYSEDIGASARISDATQLAMDPDGSTLYFTDRNNHRVRSVNVDTGETSYITGAGATNAYTGENNSFQSVHGYQEGGACADEFDEGVSGCAYFNRPTGIAVSADGNTLYVADGSNNLIRSVDVDTGATALIAGSTAAGYADERGGDARFNGPFSLSLHSNGRDLYVADKYNHAVRKVDLSNNKVSTLAGLGRGGYREGVGTAAAFNIPEYVHVGTDGYLYVSEAGNFRIRRVNLASGATELVAGTGDRGVADGGLGGGRLAQPKGMQLHGNTLYIADYLNDKVRYVDVAQ